MNVTITTPTHHAGVRYMPGDSLEVDQAAAERLVREGAARITADELLRHLRGRRLVAPPMAADGPLVRQ